MPGPGCIGYLERGLIDVTRILSFPLRVTQQVNRNWHQHISLLIPTVAHCLEFSSNTNNTQKSFLSIVNCLL